MEPKYYERESQSRDYTQGKLPEFWIADWKTGSLNLTFAWTTLLAYLISGFGVALTLGSLYLLIAWVSYCFSPGSRVDLDIIVTLILSTGDAVLGVFIIDWAIYRRTSYHLGNDVLRISRRSLFRPFAMDIAKSDISLISSEYTPRYDMWKTFVHYKGAQEKIETFAFEGAKSREEARWLSALLS